MKCIEGLIFVVMGFYGLLELLIGKMKIISVFFDFFFVIVVVVFVFEVDFNDVNLCVRIVIYVLEIR